MSRIVKKAYSFYYDDKFEELEELLKDFRDSDNIDIQYLLLYCMHDNKPQKYVSDLEHDTHRVKNLQRFADKDIGDACYHLAIHYMNGDCIEQSNTQAASLFAKGAQLNHKACILTHGLNLYYGYLNAEIDKKTGLAFIRKANDLNAQGASKALNKIETQTA